MFSLRSGDLLHAARQVLSDLFGLAAVRNGCGLWKLFITMFLITTYLLFNSFFSFFIENVREK